MSDVWQKFYNINAFDTASDPDKDGKTNLEEAQSGTNPTDKNDHYKLLNYQISPPLNQVDLTWRSLEDRTYDIQVSYDLTNWHNFHQTLGISGNQTNVLLDLPPSPPRNDNFESRLPTATDASQTIGNNNGATPQQGEIENLFDFPYKSVWWTWKPKIAGAATITTNGSNFDTTLAIYIGDSLDNLEFIDYDDQGGIGDQSSVTFIADPTKVYSIQVDGYFGDTGNIILNHPPSAGTFDQPVPNDGQPNKSFFRVKDNRFSDLDIDSDNLVTWEERLLGTDPTKPDTDGDGMNDDFEFVNEFDPNNPADGTLDADGDGISNADEIATGTNPRNPDSNGNGINDGDEDFDGDDLTNRDELTNHNTDPTNPDTDGDQMPDGWEVEYGLDPNDSDGENGQDGDPDGDGVSNFDEYLNGTDPHSTDTDNDGVDDDIEIDQGSDPNNSDDGGEAPEETLKELSFRIGDPSGSHSENWLLCIRGIGDDPDTRRIKVKSKDFGVMSDPTPFKLRVGKSYEITIQHLGTNASDGRPDYDWEATVNDLPSSIANGINPGDDISDSEVFTLENCWIVDNREAVLTRQKNGNRTNLVEGKKAYLRPLEIVPDYNRDGKIDLADRGRVNTENPWRWWINDDKDDPEITDIYGSESIPEQTDGNHTDNNINGKSDLIDFYPVYLDLKATLDIYPETEYTYKLKQDDSALNFAEAPDLYPDGDPKVDAAGAYWRSEAGEDTYASLPTTKLTPTGVSLSLSFLDLLRQKKGILLFEATKASTSPIVLEISKGSEKVHTVILEQSLDTMEKMYRHVNLSDAVGESIHVPSRTGSPPNMPDTKTKDKVFVMIHGYYPKSDQAAVNQQVQRGFNAKVFVRLYASGFNSKFVALTWHSSTKLDYHKAAYNAFKTSAILKDRLNFLSSWEVAVAGHSLGNILVSNAIAHEGYRPDNYFLINAASPVEAYLKDNQNVNGVQETKMTEKQWVNYDKRFQCSHWHENFPASDNRSKLKWKGRFKGVFGVGVNTYNFYSSGEDVVENPDKNDVNIARTAWEGFVLNKGIGRHAWVNQEYLKGGTSIGIVTFSRQHGGWRLIADKGNTPPHRFMGESSPLNPPGVYDRRLPANANAALQSGTINNEHLAQFGYFIKFDPEFNALYAPVSDANKNWTDPLGFTWVNPHTKAQGHALAGQKNTQWVLLSSAIPAKSYAVAANSTLNMVGNFDMNAMKVEWPANLDREPEFRNNWQHSDFHLMRLRFVSPMYKKILEIGEY